MEFGQKSCSSEMAEVLFRVVHSVRPTAPVTTPPRGRIERHDR